MTNKSFNVYKFRKLIIALYCLFVFICTTLVMTNVYDPNRNSVKALGSVAMDVICLVLLLILVLSITFDYHGHDRTTKLFATMLLATIWADFTDFLNWAFDGALEFFRLTYWFTVLSLCMGSVLAGVLVLYLSSYLKETHGMENLEFHAKICVGINVVSFIITFILAFTGTAFEYVDGHYKVGDLYDIVTVFPVLTLLCFIGLIVFNVKKIGIHDVLACVGYLIFMICGALIEAENGIGTTYVAVSIADVFIFVMLQNQIIVTEKQNVLTWMNRSNIDQLTGLYNRRAYETDIKEIDEEGIDEDFVFVSIDVNALKAANDSFGHSAGDELLLGAADCLKKCFGAYGRLYRIGGDEFIVLIHTDKDTLEILKGDIISLTKSWHGKLVEELSISCGYVMKSELENPTVTQMAEIADRRMYEAKNEYYRNKGIDRRKN